MGVPTIYYGSKTIALSPSNQSASQSNWRQQIDPKQITVANNAVSGIEERLNVRLDLMVSMGFRYFLTTTDATIKRNVQQWFSYAQEGNAWYFALDSSKTVLTTLANSASAGASSVVVTSATGITAGQQYVVRGSTRMELIKVDASYVGGTTIPLVETLNNDWFAGDRFRSEFYWPARLIREDNVIVEREPIWFDVNLDFIEDVQSL